MGLNGGELCPAEKDRFTRRSFVLIRAYGPPSYPAACWSPLNGTPHKNRLFHWVCCSEAVSVLPFGRGWLLSGHWDTRMNREQLAHSEQTAALQESFCMSSQTSSSAPTNTLKTLGSSPLFHCPCVSWLPSWLWFSKQINWTYKAYKNEWITSVNII